MTKHPVQPLIADEHGVLRFKENAIVRFLLDNGNHTLNDLAMMDFSNEDREQLAQLIGYSHSGFGSLSYVSDEAYEIAASQNTEYTEQLLSRISTLERKLQELSDAINNFNSTVEHLL